MSVGTAFSFCNSIPSWLRGSCCIVRSQLTLQQKQRSWCTKSTTMLQRQTRNSDTGDSMKVRSHSKRASRKAIADGTKALGLQKKSNAISASSRPNESGEAFESDSVAVVTLKRGKSKLFRDQGSCLIYAGAVSQVSPRHGSTAVNAAEVVAVVNGAGSLIGFGLYNQFSMYAVRLLSQTALNEDPTNTLDYKSNVLSLPEFDAAKAIHERIRSAFLIRRALGLPCRSTNAFRVVNGEGDKLSGLAIDLFASTAVILSSALWVERYRTEIESAVLALIHEVVDAKAEKENVIWRQNLDRLLQDGLESAGFQVADARSDKPNAMGCDSPTNDKDKSSLIAENDEVSADGIVVSENGIQYLLPTSALRKGQKSGFYADQSDQRRKIRQIVERRPGVTVLDCYCYSGGFALSAAVGGASSVTAVDTSAFSIGMGRANARINGVSDIITWVQEDVSAFMRKAVTEGASYDVVILDPPKLAPSARPGILERAVSKYRQINAIALKLVKPDGLLLSCTCSAAMTKDRDLFVTTLRQAAQIANRGITLLQVCGAAADHPLELSHTGSAGYLTACLYAVK